MLSLDSVSLNHTSADSSTTLGKSTTSYSNNTATSTDDDNSPNDSKTNTSSDKLVNGQSCSRESELVWTKTKIPEFILPYISFKTH